MFKKYPHGIKVRVVKRADGLYQIEETDNFNLINRFFRTVYWSRYSNIRNGLFADLEAAKDIAKQRYEKLLQKKIDEQKVGTVFEIP